MIRRQRPRWGVVGLGIGNQHALTLLEDELAELVAVCDTNPDVLSAVSPGYGTVARYARSKEMLDAEDLDVVSIASYDWDHARTIVDAIDRGIHVFAEKPLATCREDYVAIAEALSRNPRIRLTTNTLLRRSPRFSWLKGAIEDGEFGQLVHIQADYLYGRLPKLTHGWRGTRSDYSVTLGGAIHMVDLLMWLAGERPANVMAIGSGVGASDDGGDLTPRFRGDSLRAGLLTFPSGLTACVSANFGSVGPHFHRLDVYGKAGTFMNLPSTPGPGESAPDSLGLVLRGPDPGVAEEVPFPYPAVPKGALIPEFNRAVLKLGDVSVTEQEAMDAVAVCLAMDESVAHAEQVVIRYEEISPRG